MVYNSAIILAVLLLEVYAYQPTFKVFEIRKTRDHDKRLDYQYYDPDSNFAKIQSLIHREKDNHKLMRLAEHIVGSSASDSGFVDKTRSLLVGPRDDVFYHTYERDGKENILQNLVLSALRTNYHDIEDRTAPPIHRIPYDYDEN